MINIYLYNYKISYHILKNKKHYKHLQFSHRMLYSTTFCRKLESKPFLNIENKICLHHCSLQNL